MSDDKKFALRMVIGGKERNVSFEELALSNNLAQEALVRLLIEKKLVGADEIIKMMKTVREERYRVEPNMETEPSSPKTTEKG